MGSILANMCTVVCLDIGVTETVRVAGGSAIVTGEEQDHIIKLLGLAESVCHIPHRAVQC